MLKPAANQILVKNAAVSLNYRDKFELEMNFARTDRCQWYLPPMPQARLSRQDLALKDLRLATALIPNVCTAMVEWNVSR